jgi:hypothetical protein
VCEEARKVAQLTLLQTVDLLVLGLKQLGVLLLIQLEELAISLSNVSVVAQVSSVLHAALNNHVAQLDFLPWTDLHFEQLMAALFEVDSRHDYQVDCLAQLHQVSLGEVLHLLQTVKQLKTYVLPIDSHCALCSGSRLFFGVFHHLIEVGEVLAEDLLLDLVPLGFFLSETWIEFEHVEVGLLDEFVVKADIMGDLVRLLDQVKLGHNSWIVFEVLLSHLE